MTATPPGVSHLILGAAKSGKSTYAEGLVEALEPPYLYIATAQALDGEMADRIHAHQLRRGAQWTTLECPLELPRVLDRLRGKNHPVLLDCVTLWLTNLLLQDPPAPPEAALEALLQAVTRSTCPLFMVSNEVGGGIVPDNALARRFRDLAGTANQRLAAVCHRVTLVVAGLPLVLK